MTDERLDEQLQRMAQSRTALTEVTDRELVNKGDLVVVDFDATIEGAPFPGNSGRDVTIEVIEGQLIDGNLPQLEGAKKAEKKEFEYAFPADYKVEAVRGKTAQFAVTVKAIKTKAVPPIDDALAITMGAANLGGLRPACARTWSARAPGRSSATRAKMCSRSWWRRTPSTCRPHWSTAVST